MYMYVHVCTDDIDSLQSAMQIFIDRVRMGKDMDKQDGMITPCSSLIIACIHIEYVGRMFWGHIKLFWGRDVAHGLPIEQHRST